VILGDVPVHLLDEIGGDVHRLCLDAATDPPGHPDRRAVEPVAVGRGTTGRTQ
jgi:hypothetical protein